jgi:hypothetical protein
LFLLVLIHEKQDPEKTHACEKVRVTPLNPHVGARDNDGDLVYGLLTKTASRGL